MASLIVGAGLLIHDRIKSEKAKKKEKKRKAYESRYNELEKEHKSHQAEYLQRKATGESAMSAGNDGSSPSTNGPRRKSSQDSLGSQRDSTSQDGPAQWVAEAAAKDRGTVP